MWSDCGVARGKPSPDDRSRLEARLAELGAERLAAELAALAEADRDIERRVKLLVSEGDSDALGTELRRRIAGLARSSRFVAYRESFPLARQLAEIVEAIERKLLPLDPAPAFELADAFLETDHKTFGRIDDSSGVVADVYRDACRTWLRAAAATEDEEDWVDRIYRLNAEDGYGIRETLLQEASLLLSEDELRRLARRYEQDALEAPTDPDGFVDESFPARVRLGLVAEALEDPALYERSLRLADRELNDLQRLDVARHYLECGQAEPAIAHLEAVEDRRRSMERWSLLAEAYGQVGRKDEQLRCLWHRFEETAHFGTYEQLLELLLAGDREAAEARARDAVLELGDLLSAASFLLRIGASGEAERLTMERRAELEGTYYAHLKSLVELAEESGSPLIQMLCYRALLEDILNEARSKAYGHAARYLRCLEALDRTIDDYGAAADHPVFLEELRQRHGRKYAFWRRVEP